MKKLSTKIKDKNGEEKVITVSLDDETARLLEEYADERLRHKYIVEEYNAQLTERKETRRHQSLDKSIEGGFDIIDENADVETLLIENADMENLYKAIKTLTPQQQWLINEIFYLRRKEISVANELCVGESAIRSRLKKIYAKIKKFLI